MSVRHSKVLSVFEDPLFQISGILSYFLFMLRMLDRDLIYYKAIALCGMCVASDIQEHSPIMFLQIANILDNLLNSKRKKYSTMLSDFYINIILPSAFAPSIWRMDVLIMSRNLH